MIYASKERAEEVATMLNQGYGQPYRHIAALGRYGWVVKLDSPYSPNAHWE